MNIIDLLLIIVILFSAWSGFRKGFLFGILDLIGWVGSILIAILFYKDVTIFVEENITTLGVWTMPVIFILLMLLIRGLFSLLSNRILKFVRPETHEHTLNKVFGVGPGLVTGLVNATIIAALLLALPLSNFITERTRNSRMAGKLAEQVEWLDEKISPVFDEAINKTINRMNIVDPESKKSVSLPFTVPNPRVREDLEAKMLVLVNEERAKEGLQPLQADPELAVVARAHSKDMFARGYFSHVTPEGKVPSDRIRAGGVTFLTAGENLALGQTLKICHEGLMNSPGHRANILHKAYGRVGIGILDGGIYGLMVTQNFRN